MNELTIPKSTMKLAIDAYLQSFDEAEVGYILLGNSQVDSMIARIKGREFLKGKKVNDAVDKAILQKKIDGNSLKVDAYKLSRLDSDGRVKVKALEILGKWQKLEDPAVSNIFNVNMSWASAVMQAHQSKRKIEIIAEDRINKTSQTEIIAEDVINKKLEMNKDNLPAEEITSESESN